MDKFFKVIEQVVPLIAFYPRWAQYLFTITLIFVLSSIFLFVFHYSSASKKRERNHPITLTLENIGSVIHKVKSYRSQLQAIRDSMNEGGKVSQEKLTSFRIDYERFVRPYVLALGMNEPGEKDWHGYNLKYDNPVDLATNEFTFFHVNLALRYLNSVIGRLEYLRENPEMINESPNKTNSADAKNTRG